jgi:hypothetical protein
MDTPLQAEMREALAFGRTNPAPPLELREELRDLIDAQIGEEARAALLARPRGEPAWVNRFHLADVHSCEEYYLLNWNEDFQYSVPKAKGQVAQRAIRRWHLRRSASTPPIDDQIENVLTDLEAEPGPLGVFIANLSDGGRADLVSDAMNIVEAFSEAWPADSDTGSIKTHHSLEVRLIERRLAIPYRVAFQFGRAIRTDDGLRAAAVLLELRVGSEFEAEERSNRWLAALLETLKAGVPPARVVTWYAQTQQAFADEIEERHLRTAAVRLGDGVKRIYELQQKGEPPQRLSGWRCEKCERVADCEDGKAYGAAKGW